MKHTKAQLEQMTVAQLRQLLLNDFQEQFVRGVKKDEMVATLVYYYRRQATQERRQAKQTNQDIPAQGQAPASAAGAVIAGSDNIAYARLLALRGALKLEFLGMKHSGGTSVYNIVRKEFHFKGNKQEVLNQLNELIAQKQKQMTETSLPDD